MPNSSGSRRPARIPWIRTSSMAIAAGQGPAAFPASHAFLHAGFRQEIIEKAQAFRKDTTTRCASLSRNNCGTKARNARRAGLLHGLSFSDATGLHGMLVPIFKCSFFELDVRLREPFPNASHAGTRPSCAAPAACPDRSSRLHTAVSCCSERPIEVGSILIFILLFHIGKSSRAEFMPGRERSDFGQQR